jgi:hypothetical protein
MLFGISASAATVGTAATHQSAHVKAARARGAAIRADLIQLRAFVERRGCLRLAALPGADGLRPLSGAVRK